jgi:hypothetical protein
MSTNIDLLKHKVTVELPQFVIDTIQKFAVENHITANSVVIDAIQLARLVKDETDHQDSKLLVYKPDGEINEIKTERFFGKK